MQEHARGTGRSVHAIQQMPTATPRNTDATMAVDHLHAEKARPMNGSSSQPTMPGSATSSIWKRSGSTFGGDKNQVTALAETSLRITHGEFVALVGPSGCGKSTILKLVAGTLDSHARPRVRRRPRSRRQSSADRHGVPEPDPAAVAEHPRQRHAAAQDRAAVQAGIFAQSAKSEYRDRVEASLARVGLAGFGDKFPWQLSGGMQQRASLCRALIHDPTLLLLDEPFGALDQFTREELWEIMQNLWIEKRPTVLLVTHDLKEAAYLAIADLRDAGAARPHRR